MLIGIDGSRAFTEGKTGTENYSYSLLRALAAVDTENNYLIYIRKGQGSIIKGQDWPVNFKFKTLNLKFLWTQVGLALATFTDNLDLLFVPSHTLPLLRKPGLKTVITVHDLGAEYLPAMHQLKQILYLKLMTHYQLRTATNIIAVSHATKDDLVKRVGLSPRKVKVIYEGVDKTVFKKIGNDIYRDILTRYKLEDKKYFLFVGTIQPRKNLERLVKAFAEFLTIEDGKWKASSIIKLVLVGKKGWDSDDIYQLPHKLGIESQVVFLPAFKGSGKRISNKELAALYNGAMALTYPSLFEGFGLPILEAFACGCPVVTSNRSSMPEVAGEAALLVNPESVAEIREAMSKISHDDHYRDDLIYKGSMRYKNFDWQKAATETREVLVKAAS